MQSYIFVFMRTRQQTYAHAAYWGESAAVRVLASSWGKSAVVRVLASSRLYLHGIQDFNWSSENMVTILGDLLFSSAHTIDSISLGVGGPMWIQVPVAGPPHFWWSCAGQDNVWRDGHVRLFVLSQGKSYAWSLGTWCTIAPIVWRTPSE